MAINTIGEKFLYDIATIYDAEQRFLEGQQQMLQHASSPTLKVMLQEHIGQTAQQIDNLQQVYRILGTQPLPVTCDAAVGLVEEAQKGMQEAAGAPEMCDCVIAAAAAKVEHYEIASYHGLLAIARHTEQRDLIGFLQQNLEQEQATAIKVEESAKTLIQQAINSNGLERAFAAVPPNYV